MKSAIAIVALAATAFGLAALPASAADTTRAAWHDGHGNQFGLSLGGDDMGGMGMGMGGMGGMRHGGLIALACSPNGAEALDVALLHLSYRLNLTDAQKPLYDAFRTKALTTQTSFADQCKTAMPDRSADTKPDMLEMLKSRLAVDQARLTALNEVLPDFEALYNSLTDEQKASITPDRGFGMGMMDDQSRRPGDMGRMPRPPAMGRN
jgi:hypothetical protein